MTGKALRIAKLVIRYELNMWRSLFRWIARRRGPHPEFSYSSAVMPIIWTFIILSALEIPAFHLLLPWESVRTVVDVLGVYGLLWMIGLAASIKVNPHTASDAGLRVRYAIMTDFTVPWDAIESVKARTRSVEKSRTIQVEGDTLSVCIAHQTTVELTLREPRTVLGHTVSTIRLYADQPDELVKHVRGRLAPAAVAGNQA